MWKDLNSLEEQRLLSNVKNQKLLFKNISKYCKHLLIPEKKEKTSQMKYSLTYQ